MRTYRSQNDTHVLAIELLKHAARAQGIAAASMYYSMLLLTATEKNLNTKTELTVEEYIDLLAREFPHLQEEEISELCVVLRKAFLDTWTQIHAAAPPRPALYLLSRQ